MSSTHARAFAWLSLASLVLCSASCASAEPERYDCATAIRVATSRYSGAKMERAIDQLMACGPDGADAAARALLSLRVEDDTIVLAKLTFQFLGWRDPALLRAGQQLALDEGATPESRVFALRGLLTMVEPGLQPGYADMAFEGANRCRGEYLVSDGLNETRPVDSGYVDELRALGGRLANDDAEPRVVRLAATCLDLIPKGWRAPKYYPMIPRPTSSNTAPAPR